MMVLNDLLVALGDPDLLDWYQNTLAPGPVLVQFMLGLRDSMDQYVVVQGAGSHAHSWIPKAILRRISHVVSRA